MPRIGGVAADVSSLKVIPFEGCNLTMRTAPCMLHVKKGTCSCGVGSGNGKNHQWEKCKGRKKKEKVRVLS